MREKRTLEKQIEDLRHENQEFFNLEDKIKRYIDENEGLKTILRHKEKDIAIFNAKLAKLTIDMSHLEDQNKKFEREVSDQKYLIESLDKQRNDGNLKIRDSEKRMFEVLREKQDLEI